MWIAKPLRSLSAGEQMAWSNLLLRGHEQGRETPLAQSLAWGRAIQAVGGQVYAVFSPEQNVGGLVFSSDAKSAHLECINGPLLNWDNAEESPQQLAVFATTVARLSPQFASLILRPRWLKGQASERLPALPIAVTTIRNAATLKLELNTALESDTNAGGNAHFSARLRRTLKKSDQMGVTAQWETLRSENLVEFVIRAQAFGRARGFTVPPVFWFRALTAEQPEHERLSFGLVTAQDPSGVTGCQLFIALHGHEAHYLFGHEWRAPNTPARISPSAVAHRLAIQKCTELGMRAYDLNGQVEDATSDHPYAGVAAFKAQFNGSLVSYEVPELKITR